MSEQWQGAKILKTLTNLELQNKRVLLRAGFDVPIKDGVIQDTRRLTVGLKTIEYLLGQDVAHITVINHIGRPKDKSDTAFSNQPVIAYVSQHVSDPTRVTVRENLRFDPREVACDEVFAKELVEDQDIFVQDAFNTLHEQHTSIVLLPTLLPSYAGLVVESEVDSLSHLMKAYTHPFIVIIGGIKLDSKIPVIKSLLSKADRILLGGEVANEVARTKQFSDHKIILPIDGVSDATGVRDIGPKTIDLFCQQLKDAKTVFWNGNLGKTEDRQFAIGSKKIAECLASIKTETYIGGGDTASFIDGLGLSSKMDFISTGGGASLKFIAGEELAGLNLLQND